MTDKVFDISDAAWLRAPATERVFAALNTRGHIARAVGGCVRNALLAKFASNHQALFEQPTDIDFATTAEPDEVMAMARDAGLRVEPTGIKHGTVTVIADHQGFEVTTLRRDVETDGRHATVAFTDDWVQDASRRDFTMNALYAEADGVIFDPLGGLGDIEARYVRFVGDARRRIQEDGLRILRFFRFFAQYGEGAPDADGLRACVLERTGLDRLSAERIHQELVKLLVAPRAIEAVDLLIGYGLLGDIMPSAPTPWRFAALVARDRPANAALRLAALGVHCSDDALRLTRKLRLSRREGAVLGIAGDVLEQSKYACPDEIGARQLLYQFGADGFRHAIKLLATLNGAAPDDPDWGRHLSLPERWPVPTFPLSGADLISHGLAAPGPELGRLLGELEALWIASDFTFGHHRLLKEGRSLIDAR